MTSDKQVMFGLLASGFILSFAALSGLQVFSQYGGSALEYVAALSMMAISGMFLYKGFRLKRQLKAQATAR